MQKAVQRNGHINLLFPIYIFPLNVCGKKHSFIYKELGNS